MGGMNQAKASTPDGKKVVAAEKRVISQQNACLVLSFEPKLSQHHPTLTITTVLFRKNCHTK